MAAKDIMFSGIIENLGKIRMITPDKGNLTFTIESSLTPELKPDQSVSHNGCCLTVEKIEGPESYTVTAIEESLKKTNLGKLNAGEPVNLERSITLGTRLDGHLVQGHVDAVAKCIAREEKDGSVIFIFEYPAENKALLVEKGSITVNGVSLTAFDCKSNRFSVAIIPYTLEHTTFKFLRQDHIVNLEYDILGKYFQRWIENSRGTI